MRYTWEFKLECVDKYKNGEHIETPPGCKCRRTFLSHVGAWAKAYGDLRADGLKRSPTNKGWTPEQRFGLVAKVLAGNGLVTGFIKTMGDFTFECLHVHVTKNVLSEKHLLLQELSVTKSKSKSAPVRHYRKPSAPRILIHWKRWLRSPPKNRADFSKRW